MSLFVILSGVEGCTKRMIKIDDICDFKTSEDVLMSRVKIVIEAIDSFPESVEYVEQFLRSCETHLSISLKNSKKVLEERNSKMFSLDQTWYAEAISTLLLLCNNDEDDLYNQIDSLILKIGLEKIDTSYLRFEYH
tara:strand:+ start:54 stop:461 length:408 start_codon:yes stop_codon:yes gene_type:complete